MSSTFLSFPIPTLTIIRAPSPNRNYAPNSVSYSHRSDTLSELVHFLDLPDDILELIMTQFVEIEELLSLRATCTHLFQLARDSTVKIDLHAREVGHGSLESIAKSFPNLQQLEYDHNAVQSSVNDASVRLLSQSCQRLVSLDAGQQFVQVTDSALWYLAQGCVNLHYLCITNCGLITDTGLWALAQGCPQLRRLMVNGCKQVSDTGLSFIASKCTNLRGINVSRTKVTDDGLQALAAVCPSLTAVIAHNCAVSDSILVTLAEKCPNLTELRAKHSTRITDVGLIALAKGCGNLQVIVLSGCRVNDAGASEVAMRCPNLRRLSILSTGNLTNATLLALATNASQLEELTLEDLQDGKITDKGVMPLAVKCQKLTILVLRNAALSDLSLRMLSTHCKRLQELNVLHSRAITPSGLQLLQRRGCMIMHNGSVSPMISTPSGKGYGSPLLGSALQGPGGLLKAEHLMFSGLSTLASKLRATGP